MSRHSLAEAVTLSASGTYSTPWHVAKTFGTRSPMFMLSLSASMSALAGGDGCVLFGEHVCHLLQRKAELANFNELVNERYPTGREPAL